MKLDPVREERVRKVLATWVRPAIFGPAGPLEVAAHHVRGEPITYAEAVARAYQPFPVGGAWGPPWDTTWFHLTGAVPRDWAGEEVVMRFEIGNAGDTGFGAEALVWSSDGPVQGLSPNHRRYRIAERAAGGEAVDLYVEAAANPKAPFHLVTWPLLLADPDGPPEFTLARADLAVFRREVFRFYQDFRLLFGLYRDLPADEPRASRLGAALNAAAGALDLDDVPGSLKAAWPVLQAELARPAAASAHHMSAVGHAHIDTAWLWPLRETIRKCARTFSTAVTLMDRYPEYRFACSQPQQYAWMKEHYPDLYRRIRDKVAGGQFVPTGAMWVEADCNVPSGESLVRQVVHGKRFFADEFGVDIQEVWLPDVFGYSAGLPQIMNQAGVRWFLTQKLSWNQYNRLPHHTFRWQGIDGSRVLTHFPPADTYNGAVTAEELRYAVRNFADHDRSDRSLYLFGYGDGGGGPTEEMLETARAAADVEGLPRLRIESPSDFFEAVESELPDPPLWVGELYFEMHRGTYTTQAATKAGNRRGELALREAELWSALAPGPWDAYPAGELDRAWKTLLLHQFHDIIPGSSIHWVYDDTRRDHAAVIEVGERAATAALQSLAAIVPTAALTNPVVVANSLSWARQEVIELPEEGTDAWHLVDTDDIASATQRSAGGRLLARVASPACGYQVLDLRPGPGPVPSSTARASADGLENDWLRVVWDDQGSLVSVWDKRIEREVLAGPGNRFHLHPDYPNNYDAWDIDHFAFDTTTEIDGLSSVEIIEDGPLRASVRMVRSFSQSSITQVISLTNTGPRLDFATEIDWNESHRLLKVAFPVTVHSHRATYEIQFGHVERPTHANTSWDLARFEVCAHRWADLSEDGYGVALLNDSKYGYDIRGNVMRLTLLRAPSWPDPQADRGVHRFTYALLPHPGDLRSAGVIEEGYQLNVPLQTVLAGSGQAGMIPAAGSFLSVDTAHVVLETVKKADNGDALIVRGYEAWGRRGPVRITSGLPLAGAEAVDLLECRAQPVAWDRDGVDLELRPFQLFTLRLEFEE